MRWRFECCVHFPRSMHLTEGRLLSLNNFMENCPKYAQRSLGQLDMVREQVGRREAELASSYSWLVTCLLCLR